MCSGPWLAPSTALRRRLRRWQSTRLLDRSRRPHRRLLRHSRSPRRRRPRRAPRARPFRSVERRLTGMIAAAAVLIVLFIFWDVFRPVARAVDSSAPPPTTLAVDSIARPIAPPTPPPAAPQPVAPATTASQGTAGPTVPAGRQPTYFDLLARSETRRRIRLTGPTTYLCEW